MKDNQRHCKLSLAYGSKFHPYDLIMKKLFIACALILSFGVEAQQKTSAQLYEDLKGLKVLGSVLHIAAHPDDESTHMLTWFAQEQQWETSYFACNRGEGGQNLIGDEQGVALGLIRTQELLAARRIDGANQYFSRAFDFGFSKSTDEALGFWGKELILSDMVWVIRKLRPDIIFTRFPPDARAGHGHHSASAVLAIEAFKAAADPNRFPEQLKLGVEVWQAKRLLWNTFRFPGSANSTVSEDQFKFEIGNYLPSIGQSTGEMAAFSRSQHKSQGFGFSADRGKSMEYFVTLAGTTPVNKLWDGVDVSWARIPGAAAIENAINQIIQNYKISQPHVSIPSLIGLKKSISALPQSTLRDKKLKQINDWVIKAAGINLNAYSNAGIVSRGDSIKVKAEFIVRSAVEVSQLKITVGDQDSTWSGKIAVSKKQILSRTILVGSEISQPYWIKKPKEIGRFNVDDPMKIGQANPDPAILAKVTFLIEGEEFQIEKPIQEMIVDPIKGEIYQPISISPKSVFSLNSNVLLLAKGSKSKKTVELTIYALGKISPGSVEVQSNQALSLVNIPLPKGLKKGEKMTFNIPFDETKFSDSGKISQKLSLAYETQQGNWVDSLELQSIEYPHIPTQRYFSPVNLDILHIDIKKQGSRIGYIKGAGDKVPEAIKQLGYQIDFLSETDLNFANLKKYDAVLTGVRAHNTLNYMVNAYPELMKYVENGGNYVVQYNTASFLGPIKSSMAPYPMAVGRNRITREDAIPEFLLPSHALLNIPNKISETDFDHWVQERSIYTAESDDSHFEFPLGFTDPGEKLNKGNITVCKFGKGQFIYTGLVFFRELPAAVPGAWRLFANLISNPNLK